MVEKIQIDDVSSCPECRSEHIVRDYERGELICVECGIVIDDLQIDLGPEWRAFDSAQGDARARTGSPMTFSRHDKGLSTEISWMNRDSNGKSIPARNRAQMYRMRKWQRRVRISNASERNLIGALSELNKVASDLGLPGDIKEAAALIYRNAVHKNLIRGRSIEGVVATSIYAACRQCNVPRTLDEISASSRVNRKEIGRTYRFIMRALNMKLMPTTPQDYVSRFTSELKLSSETINKANEVLKQADDLEITSGRGPTGMAAAAIYIATVLTSERRTQRDIAMIAGVTEVTIRNRYKEMSDQMGIDLVI
jgi:transcription initiation factor TFIIB